MGWVSWHPQWDLGTSRLAPLSPSYSSHSVSPICLQSLLSMPFLLSNKCPRAGPRSFSCQIGSHIEVQWPKPPPQNVWSKLLWVVVLVVVVLGSSSSRPTGCVSAGVSPPTVTRLTSAAAAPARPTRRCTALQLHAAPQLHTAQTAHRTARGTATHCTSTAHCTARILHYCTLSSTCHHIWLSAFQWRHIYDAKAYLLFNSLQ